MCPKCNFHNYRSKAVCPQCSTPMPAGGGTQPSGGDSKGEEGGSKKRRSKWDDDGGAGAAGEQPKEVPEWLQDLVPKEAEAPRPPPGVNPENFKVIKMDAVQVRALIGKGGETIRDIRTRSGADIKIDHLPQDPEGKVTIVGEVEKVEGMIKEALSSKGCPLGVPRPAPAVVPGMPGMLAIGAPGLPGTPAASVRLPGPAPGSGPMPIGDLTVPSELVGPLIGPGGATIQDIRAKAGGNVYISVLPPASPGGAQAVRIVGDQRELAKGLLVAKIEELKKNNQMSRPPILPSMLPGATRPGGLLGCMQAGGVLPRGPCGGLCAGMGRPMLSLPGMSAGMGGAPMGCAGALGSMPGQCRGSMPGALGGMPGQCRSSLPNNGLMGALGGMVGQGRCPMPNNGMMGGCPGGPRPHMMGGLHAKSVGVVPPRLPASLPPFMAPGAGMGTNLVPPGETAPSAARMPCGSNAVPPRMGFPDFMQGSSSAPHDFAQGSSMMAPPPQAMACTTPGML